MARNLLERLQATFKAVGYEIPKEDIETDTANGIVTFWGGFSKPATEDEAEKRLEFVSDGKECFLRLDLIGDTNDEQIEIMRQPMSKARNVAETFAYMARNN